MTDFKNYMINWIFCCIATTIVSVRYIYFLSCPDFIWSFFFSPVPPIGCNRRTNTSVGVRHLRSVARRNRVSVHHALGLERRRLSASNGCARFRRQWRRASHWRHSSAYGLYQCRVIIKYKITFLYYRP